MCIFLLQIIIHIQVVTQTEDVGCVMEGTVCAQDYTFLWENTLSFKDRIFYNHRTILSVKTFEVVSDRILVSMWFCRQK